MAVAAGFGNTSVIFAAMSLKGGVVPTATVRKFQFHNLLSHNHDHGAWVSPVRQRRRYA